MNKVKSYLKIYPLLPLSIALCIVSIINLFVAMNETLPYDERTFHLVVSFIEMVLGYLVSRIKLNHEKSNKNG